MATITITESKSTGLDPLFADPKGLEVGDRFFGEGAFGQVYHCHAMNGVPLPRAQAVKVLLNDGSGSDERGLRTIRQLQTRVLQKVQKSGLDSITQVGALGALPQFSFRGEHNGRAVVGYSAHLLQSTKWTEFGKLFNEADLDVRKTLHQRFYNLPLDARLRMAHELVKGFALFEELGFIYADLNPKNFFVDLDHARLCLIDYEGGAVNEDPETFGKLGEWLAPEIQAQLLHSGSGKVKVDLNTDTWAVAIGVHFMLFPFHPLFFLAQRGPADMQRYFAKHSWPDIDPSDSNFREPAAYSWYRRAMSSVPDELVRAFAETVNHGWANRSKRLSYNQWERAIAVQMKPPVIKAFVSDRSSTIAGVEVTLRWEVERAVRVEIDNGVGEVIGASEIKVRPQVPVTYTLQAIGHFGVATARVEVLIFPTPLIESLFVPTPNVDSFVRIDGLRLAPPIVDLHVRLDRDRLSDVQPAWMRLNSDVAGVTRMRFPQRNLVTQVCDRVKRMLRSTRHTQ